MNMYFLPRIHFICWIIVTKFFYSRQPKLQNFIQCHIYKVEFLTLDNESGISFTGKRNFICNEGKSKIFIQPLDHPFHKHSITLIFFLCHHFWANFFCLSVPIHFIYSSSSSSTWKILVKKKNIYIYVKNLRCENPNLFETRNLFRVFASSIQTHPCFSFIDIWLANFIANHYSNFISIV